MGFNKYISLSSQFPTTAHGLLELKLDFGCLNSLARTYKYFIGTQFTPGDEDYICAIQEIAHLAQLN